MPVEFPSKLELVIRLKIREIFGSLKYRRLFRCADEVIE